MRVIICEDHALVRDGLERLLSTHGFEIAASVDTAEAFLAAVKRERLRTCACVDVRLPPSVHRRGRTRRDRGPTRASAVCRC